MASLSGEMSDRAWSGVRVDCSVVAEWAQQVRDLETRLFTSERLRAEDAYAHINEQILSKTRIDGLTAQLREVLRDG